MFYIRFYNFDKRVNSLKIPGTSDDFTRYRCNVKTSSSIINPVIELKVNNVPEFNYCYIEEFRRYYHITDITSSMGIWIISCACDILASFRDDILNSRQYIVRSASNYDPDLIDTFYPARESVYKKEGLSSDNVYRYDTSTSTWKSIKWFNRRIDGGGFCIGILSANKTGITYYVMGARAFKKILQFLMTYQPADMSAYTQTISNAIFNPMQYITSARWYPVEPLSGNTGGSVSTINIGGHDFNVTSDFGFSAPEDVAYIMDSYCIEQYYVDMDLPHHPDRLSYPYLEMSPYSEYNLYFQPFGDMPLDSTKIYGASSLKVKWTIDFTSGAVSLEVTADNDSTVFTTVTEIGVTLPITAMTMEWQGAVLMTGLNYLGNAAGKASASGHWDSLKSGLWGLKQTISNALTGQSGSGYIPAPEQNASLLDTVQDALAASLGQTVTKGAPGSFLTYNMGRAYVYAWFRITTDHDDARFGRPLQQNRRLDNLTGFAICGNATVNYSGGCPTLEEKRQVESMLNNGVFIE